MSISLCNTPLTIGGDLELKNRVVLAPLTRGRSGTDQCPKQHSVDYYVQRAGAGLLISEGTIPSQQGMGWSGAPAIYSPEHVAAWRKVTDAVHAAGSKIVCQLWHMGRVTHSSFHGLQPVSASAIGVEGNAWCLGKTKKPYEVPRALEAAEIPRVVEELRHAAACAKVNENDSAARHTAAAVAELKRAHGREVAAILGQYESLRDAVNDYHSDLADVLDMPLQPRNRAD